MPSWSVHDLWEPAERAVLADSQKIEIVALKTQIEALKERLSDAEGEVRTTEDRVALERIELKEELSALLVDHVDFAATIEKARRLMRDLPTSWNTIEPLQRLVFLRFLVPDGLGYQNGAFGTPDNPSGIRGIAEFFDPKKQVALPAGFEPALPP